MTIPRPGFEPCHRLDVLMVGPGQDSQVPTPPSAGTAELLGRLDLKIARLDGDGLIGMTASEALDYADALRRLVAENEGLRDDITRERGVCAMAASTAARLSGEAESLRTALACVVDTYDVDRDCLRGAQLVELRVLLGRDPEGP